jgi:hypothetical protein
MTPRAAAPVALGLAVALAISACGSGGGKGASTSTPTTAESTSSSAEATTTSTTIDPALKALLLVADDLPQFKEAANPSPDQDLFKTCDPAEVPAFKVLYDAPSVDGSTFSRGADDAVEVTSSVTSTTAEQGQAGLDEVLEPKAVECLQTDLQALTDKDKPEGTTATVKVTTAKSTVAGVDQTVLLSTTTTVKQGATTTTTEGSSTTRQSSSTTKQAATQVIRQDLVFLRLGGTILVVTYLGPSGLTSTTERQRIVAVAAKKLTDGTSGSTSTTTGSGSGSSTSSTRGSSTTRRSTTSTSTRGSTSSSRSTSTT